MTENTTDIKLVLSEQRVRDINAALQKRSKILGRVRSYESSTSPGRNGRNANFVASPYQLEEISRAMDVEPYIGQSIRKHRIYVLKEGYSLEGTDEEAVAYVRQRLLEIAMVTGIPTFHWLRELVTNVIVYHNGYLILRRDRERSSGKPIKIYNKQLAPIAGIFIGDPLSLGVEIDKYSTPIRWKQNVNSSDGTNPDLVIDPEDVIHIPLDRKTGMFFGTPYLVSVLDDIRALRKLEELVLVIAEKEAYPLYHYKVGTETKPATIYDDGTDEISLVLSQLSGTPTNGYVVTSERHEINLISRDKSAFDLTPLLDYFEKRVLGGLSLSDVDLGRGDSSSRSTATTISKNLEDSSKDYQQIVSAHLTQFLVIPLLLEGGFDITPENMVEFKFPLANTEEVRAQQNHGLTLFNNNAISRSEYRAKYLNNNKDIDEEDTLMHKQMQADITVAKNTPRPASASSKKGTSSAKNTASNKARPTNQHGSVNKSRFKKRDNVIACASLLDSLKNSIITLTEPTEDKLNQLILDFCNKATEASKETISDFITAGFLSAEEQYFDMFDSSEDEFEEIGSRAINRFMLNFVSKSFSKVLSPYKSLFVTHLTPDEDGNTSSYQMIKSFEAIGKAISDLCEDQVETAKRFGFSKFAKRAGYQNIDLMDINEECVEQINISEIIYKDLIPSEKNRDCILSLPIDKIND